jgi:putative transposase
VKKCLSNEEVVGFLWEAESGLPMKELCRRHGFSEVSYYLWQSKTFRGMTVSDAKHLRELKTENTQLMRGAG